jgi:hypothetical protein
MVLELWLNPGLCLLAGAHPSPAGVSMHGYCEVVAALGWDQAELLASVS